MKRSAHTRNLLAGIFLLIFAFGTTPKITLHNLVANHRDGRTKTSLPDPYSTQVSKSVFNCQCDNPVIESPFVAESNTFYTDPCVIFSVYSDTIAEYFFSTDLFCFGLRGPPAC